MDFRALSEARVTDREKTVLFDKFGLILQTLVSYQESEVEVIDNLRMKTNIMEVLNAFISADVEVGQALISPDDLVTEKKEGEVGYKRDSLKDHDSDNLPEVEEEPDKRHRNIQGVSVDEMSAPLVRETLLLQKNKYDSKLDP